MVDILKSIREELPKAITSAEFEGANIVLYTEDKDFFKNGESQVKSIVDKIKKRIELRADKSILASEEETEKTIKALVPEEAEITNIIFDIQRSIVVIEAKKPGMVIGKQGSILADIKKSTLFIPVVQRSSVIPSKITEKIRSVLYANNNYRRKFLNDIGKKIYTDWNPEKMDMWVRITYLGGGRQVGRSCVLLHTPNSKVLLDCGINPAISEGTDKFPYLNVSEIGDLNSIDAIILSHAHLDHCLPPHSLVLTEKGYKKIDEVKIGENIISMNWKTGKYVASKCTEKTQTTGHKKVLTIKTPYSTIESSPNHRFFTFENLELKEVEASELKRNMLLPSNLLHKSEIHKNKIMLDTSIRYDKRRKDSVVLPTELTPDLAEFIGYYLGDGHKSSEFSLRLIDHSTQILEYHKENIRKMFNFEATIRHHSDKTKNAFILEINNIKIIRFLEKNFPEIYKMTRDIRVPEKILESSMDIQKAFLRGFSDAEGTVTDIVKITSFSDKMLDNLQHLFSLQGIPSNINSDHSICLNTKFSICKFFENIGFSLNYKQEKLRTKLKGFSALEFEKQDLLPINSVDLRKILKESGMFGRVHNSPRLSEFLPMCLLDLFRRKRGYATRKTITELISLLDKRIEFLRNTEANIEPLALRQILSLTREEVGASTGLSVSQVQQLEENRISISFANKISSILSTFMKEKLSTIISQTLNNMQILNNLLSMNLIWERISNIEERENPYPYLVDIEVENHNFVAGNIIVHNSGLIPYLFKMGYKGPIYLTAPTRDIAALLQLDLIGVAYKDRKSVV